MHECDVAGLTEWLTPNYWLHDRLTNTLTNWSTGWLIFLPDWLPLICRGRLHVCSILYIQLFTVDWMCTFQISAYPHPTWENDLVGYLNFLIEKWLSEFHADHMLEVKLATATGIKHQIQVSARSYSALLSVRSPLWKGTWKTFTFQFPFQGTFKQIFGKECFGWDCENRKHFWIFVMPNNLTLLKNREQHWWRLICKQKGSWTIFN